jgi:subtilisin family serine protease
VKLRLGDIEIRPAKEQASPATLPFDVYHIVFTNPEACERFKNAKVHIFNRFDRYAEGFVAHGDYETVRKLVNDAGVVWLEESVSVISPPPPPPKALQDTLAGPGEEIVRDGWGDLDGEGVVIAIVDAGIDFRHPDFQVDGPGKSKESRLAYYWDTMETYIPGQRYGSPAKIKYPSNKPIGTIYSQKELTAALAGGPAAQVLKDADLNGHGTACAGIAAGNGRASGGQYAGVAPRAELVAIRIGYGSLPNAFLLNAICDWLDKTFPGRPVVVSCSFGDPTGGHDGFRVCEQHLDAWLARNRPGLIVCIAAGNEGELKQHARGYLSRGSSWDVDLHSGSPYVAGRGTFELYLDASDSSNVQLELVQGQWYNTRCFRSPLSQALVLMGEVGTPARLKVSNIDSPGFTADIYLAKGLFFASPNVQRPTNEAQLSTPGCTPNAITVASYDFSDTYAITGTTGAQFLTSSNKYMQIGEISDYSSGGPLRRSGEGEPYKPDLAAPGQWHLAPAAGALKVQATSSGQLHSSGSYLLFSGTSAATPYVAGVSALCLQKTKGLSQVGYKGLLLQHLTRRGVQGVSPNGLWGYGQLNMPAVSRLLGPKIITIVVEKDRLTHHGRPVTPDEVVARASKTSKIKARVAIEREATAETSVVNSLIDRLKKEGVPFDQKPIVRSQGPG